MQIEVLGERYQLQDPIGRGGMATIYRGRDIRMDRVVAIKVLREVYSTDPKFVTRFQREAKAASSLQHPNIVQVYDYGQSDGNYFIVMELVEGTDLRRYLRSRGVLAIDRAIIIAHDVALGLGAAHRRGIVHRDVKPQNVLVGKDGSIKLTDFGIASVYKDINAERLTTTGMTLGTVQYYAPEQAQGEIVNPAADVYALGIVMYEMLTGRTPFDGDTPVAVAMQHIQDAPMPPSQLNSNIPPALEEIILRCLEKVPEMRFRDGNTLARALELLGEEDINGTQAANVPPFAPGSQNGHNSGIYNQPTQQPSPRFNSGERPPLQQSNSSPNNRMGPPPFNGNGVSENYTNYAPDAPGISQSNQSSYPLSGAGGTMTEMVDQRQMPPMSYSQPPPLDGSVGATRPFRRGTIVRDEQRETRVASVITVFILVATLLLLGFSIYLAGELGFLPMPWASKSSGAVTVTPSPTQVQQVAVPDLKGQSYQQAQQTAKAKGFQLKINTGDQTGVVQNQAPTANTNTAPGSTILVDLAPVLKVPAGLTNDTLAHAEALLDQQSIKYTVARDPNDPFDSTQKPNTVTRTDPDAGTTLQKDQTVTIYVVNWFNGTPTVVPPTPTPLPTPTPTPRPTPTPTPTATPTDTPTPTPTKPPKTKTPTVTVTITTTIGTGSGTPGGGNPVAGN